MAIDDIALTLVPGLGVKGVVHLLEVFGTAQAIFAASADELAGRAELRPDVARSIAARKSHPEAERELRHCRRHGITPLASTDDAYPALLREIPDYPHVLYEPEFDDDREAAVARARDAGLAGPGDSRFAVVVELRFVEVRVGIDQFHRARFIGFVEFLSSFSRLGKARTSSVLHSAYRKR